MFAFRLTLTSEVAQLPSVEPLFNEVRFSTPSTNSNSIYLSDSPVNAVNSGLRFAVAKGKDFPLKLTNLSQLYAYGTSNDVLDVMCEISKEAKP